MNDVEHDLRELLDRKAGSVGTVAPRLPDGVRARSRRRQLATTAVGAVTAVAIGVVSLAGLRAIDRAQPDGAVPVDDPWAGYTVFERTATIETLTLTTPSDWYLVNQWPMGARASNGSASSEASGDCDLTIPPDGQAPTGDCGSPQPSDQRVGSTTLPLLVLANVDLGLGRSACLDGGLPLDGEEAVLEVAIDTVAVDQIEAGAGPDLPAWPIGFDEGTVASGPCGEGHYARFQVGRYPYVAWVGFGPDVTDEDRRSLFDLASTMRIDARAFIQGTLEETPGYVIAGGENAAGQWRLELRPSTSDAPTANVDLSVVSPEGGAGAGDFTVPGGALIVQAGGDPVFGAVTKDAAGVEIRSNLLLPGSAATIVPLPPSLPFDFDLFFGSHEGDAPPTAVPVDAAGDPIGNMAGISEGNGSIALFDILGTQGSLMTDRSTGITCYAVTSEHGFVDGCADEVTLQTIPLPDGRGQILVFSHVDAIRLSDIELDVDGGETLAGSKCHGPVCVMGIPQGSGTGTLWLLQKGQRADSAPIAWTPEGVERT